MTSRLTRTTLGILSLFFVCVIVGAMVLKNRANNATIIEAAKTTRTAEPLSEVKKNFDPVEFMSNQQSKSGNISYYGGQLTD